jgi:hypothetical protein
MEHPLISSINDLTADQLSEKLSELNKKLGIAYRMGNADLCNQLRMAIETYQNKYTEKTRKGDTGPYQEVIDIS